MEEGVVKWPRIEMGSRRGWPRETRVLVLDGSWPGGEVDTEGDEDGTEELAGVEGLAEPEDGEGEHEDVTEG